MIARTPRANAAWLRTVVTGSLLLCTSGACRAPQVPPIQGGWVDVSGGAEEALWREANRFEAKMRRAGVLHDDEALQRLADGTMARLMPKLGAEPHLVRVYFVRDPLAHAAALPNGAIYLHTGLLAVIDNEDQLALVLGHEAAHFVRRHALAEGTALRQNASTAAAVATLLTIATVGVAAHPDIVGPIFSFASFSRDMEREADARSLDALISAGYDGADALRVLYALRDRRDEAGIREPSLGSHPQLEERIENSEEALRARGIEPRPQKEPARVSPAFAEAVSEILLINARLDLDLGRFEHARRAIDRHIAHAPTSAAGFVALGEFNRRAGDSPAALTAAAQAFERAVLLDPNLGEAQRELGLLHRAQGRTAEADRALARYLELTPGAVDRPIIESYLTHAAEPPQNAP